MKEKNTKKKQLDAKDVTSSPYFVAALMGVCIAIAIAGLVFFILQINTTKNQITEARRLYIANEQEVDVLAELKKKSEEAYAQIEEFDNLLPQSLGNAYELRDNVLTKFTNFGLNVTAIDFITVKNETHEIVFTISCTGSFESIYNVMNHYSNIEQIHRIDSLSITKDSADDYTAVITLAILSEQPVEGVVAGMATGV